MLTNQKHLFELDEDITYLNGAYMSPQLKSVTALGIESLKRKAKPYSITPEDFIEIRNPLKKRFAQLIKASDYQDIAIIPSVSYGMANVANSLNLKPTDEILVAHEQFPSNIYSWQHLAERTGAKIINIEPPTELKDRGRLWNEKILNAINPNTALVALAHCHWADGTRFQLAKIGEKVHKKGGKLVIDGTQSVGAFPFSVAEIKPDALICGGYKWLLGPYSLGVAYYAESLHYGNPIEHNWMNRADSEDFSLLTNYQENYQSRAGRFSVGESSNFVLTPMLTQSIEQLIEWTPQAIQEYCKEISQEAVSALREMGCYIEEDGYRGQHLFGIYLPQTISIDKVKAALSKEKILVSYRGNAIRVSPHVYNTAEDFEKLISVFKTLL
ncbi:aminotransferase class V-fold PLP-dependent enzyme [Leeuwenhoekiella sp. A16]|uniref:aminotransferase class V-fold PLP-dependent enzyme n=1 Tax=unclassified Leeuwenhoekiella TaxID=2615029 RepID=UPI003A80EC84